MNPIAGRLAWPARRGRPREAPMPTIISTDSVADIEKKGDPASRGLFAGAISTFGLATARLGDET
jgi:hypothetical protein